MTEAAPVTVVITGEPVAKARLRVTRRGITYTPAHTRKYEAHGRLAAQLAMGDRPPIEAPVRLELVVELPIPASWSGRRRALAVTGDLLPTSRPDVDNYIKAGLDSLNEIVVRDDSQVVELGARKRFSIAPKLMMTVFPLGAASSKGREMNARRRLPHRRGAVALDIEHAGSAWWRRGIPRQRRRPGNSQCASGNGGPKP